MSTLTPLALPRRRPLDTGLEVYAELRRRVRETFIRGRARIEREKVRVYHETGRLIQVHILHHKERAEYGKRLIGRLAEDLEIGERVLQRSLQFYRRFPQIPSARTELTWTHYRLLITISNDQKRLEFAERAAREQWASRELEQKIRKFRAQHSPLHGPRPAEHGSIEPRRGKLNTYAVIDWNGKKAYDLGFATYREIKGKQPAGPAPKPEDLYTYQAQVERVVDGDTIWMKVYLGFDTWVREKLRLRGIDTPELGTPAGEAAKRFVASQLKKARTVTITTTKPDKWDRYLSDIFFTPPGGREIYLNNLLLKRGHARKMDRRPRLHDWEKI